jgi:hypothetical protein
MILRTCAGFVSFLLMTFQVESLIILILVIKNRGYQVSVELVDYEFCKRMNTMLCINKS